MLILVGLLAAIWLLTGVGGLDVALYLGYLAAFVALPGWVVLRLLDAQGRGGPLRRFCEAFALGLSVSTLAYIAAAAVGARWSFALLPAAALVAVAATPRIRGALNGWWGSGDAYPGRWLMVGAAGAALVLVSIEAVAVMPLPGTGRTVGYPPDLPGHVALVAEVLHHWPVEWPWVAGVGARYHLFAHFQMASAADVTGIEASMLVFRLTPLALVLALALGIYMVTVELFGRAWPAAVATLLFFAAGEADLLEDPYVFFSALFTSLIVSPSLLMGFVVFMPLLLRLIELVGAPRSDPREVGVLALLMAGAAGAKATIMPVILGALLLVGAWETMRRRRLTVGFWISGGLTVAVMAVFLVAMYGSGSAGGVVVDPPGAVQSANVVHTAYRHFVESAVLRQLVYLVGIPVTIVGFLGPMMLGLLAAPSSGKAGGRIAVTLPLAALAVSLVPFVLFTHAGFSQAQFTYYGLLAAVPLAGMGLVRLAERAWSRLGPVLLVAVGTGAAIAGATAVVLHTSSWGSEQSIDRWLFMGAVAAATAIGSALMALRRGRWRTAGAALAASTLMAAGSLDVPLDQSFRRSVDLAPMTPDLYAGLRWIRASTPKDAVLAVNRVDVFPTRGDHLYMVWSGFSERRTYLSGAAVTTQGNADLHGVIVEGKEPFPERRRINDRVFQGDREALALMQRQVGVDLLVADRALGGERIRSLGRVVFENDDILVVAVSAGAGALEDAARAGTRSRRPGRG